MISNTGPEEWCHVRVFNLIKLKTRIYAYGTTNQGPIFRLDEKKLAFNYVNCHKISLFHTIFTNTIFQKLLIPQLTGAMKLTFKVKM